MVINWQWGADLKKKGTDGFNNASILTFNSHAINSFVRELFQNSNDAKATGEEKVIIQIESKKIRKELIPDFDQFVEIFRLVQQTHPQHAKFFKKAYEVLGNDEIPFLIYSDSNTKGLQGNEGDEKSSFMACVLGEGISVKESKSAGGSYGIGKNAIYGISALRTIIYSSLNLENEHIFQGVSKLASYKLNGQNREGRIYLGSGEDRISVRDENAIPPIFRRKQPGLSQFVMGVDLESNWQMEFAKAIVRNYWPLLVEDGLEVQICENGQIRREINASNVVQLIEELFKEEEDEYSLKPYGNPYLFYEAFSQGNKVEFEIPIIGKCSFHYYENVAGENNIAYLRNGMVILSDIEKRLVGANVTGIFRCETNHGNEILRLMEPPKHDSFEPQMLDDHHEFMKKKDGEKILKSVKSNIRDTIKTLIAKYKEETETPLFITELFEDIQKQVPGTKRGLRTNESSLEETIYRRAIEDVIEVSLDSHVDNSYVSSNRGEVQVEGAGINPGAFKGQKKSKTKRGQSPSRGSSVGGKSPKYPITSRIFHLETRNGRNVYKAVLSCAEDIDNVEVKLFQYADSGEEVAFQLNDIKSLDGSSIKFLPINDSEGGISEYRIFIDYIMKEKQLILDVSDNQKSAFIIKG